MTKDEIANIIKNAKANGAGFTDFLKASLDTAKQISSHYSLIFKNDGKTDQFGDPILTVGFCESGSNVVSDKQCLWYGDIDAQDMDALCQRSFILESGFPVIKGVAQDEGVEIRFQKYVDPKEPDNNKHSCCVVEWVRCGEKVVKKPYVPTEQKESQSEFEKLVNNFDVATSDDCKQDGLVPAGQGTTNKGLSGLFKNAEG